VVLCHHAKCGSGKAALVLALLELEACPLRSKAIMKVELKPIIDALEHDGNQLEHHARKLRTISPNLEAEAEEIDDRVASIRKQIEVLEQWE
jgi:hypothetical protein